MRAALVAALALAACRGAPVAAPARPAGPPAPTTLDAAAIDAWLGHQLAERGVVGAAVAIVHDGKPVLAKGYGTKRVGTVDPPDADTPFALGSVTKQLTCAAVGLLADEGKLSFDDPVAKYYPALTRAADITLDDLGAHLAGYRDYYPLDYKDRRMERSIAPDELLATYAGMPLDFEPRTRMSYSNTGYVLLGRIAERVAGVPLGQLVEQRIFTPLGMRHAKVGAPAGAATGHVAFVLGPAEVAAPEAAGWEVGAFGAYASANDLARWDLAFSTGAILSEASRTRLASPRRLRDGRTSLYGCGLGMRMISGEQVLAHTGAVEGYYAYNAFIPRTQSATILLVNDTRFDVADLHARLVTLLADRPEEVPAIPGPGPEETVRELLTQLARGAIERDRLGDDLSAYFDPRRVEDAAARLRALGAIKRVTLRARHERGGMEVSEVEVELERKTLTAVMFRAPTGKVHQLNLVP